MSYLQVVGGEYLTLTLMQLFSFGAKEAGLIEHQNAYLINQLIS